MENSLDFIRVRVTGAGQNGVPQPRSWARGARWGRPKKRHKHAGATGKAISDLTAQGFSPFLPPASAIAL